MLTKAVLVTTSVKVVMNFAQCMSTAFLKITAFFHPSHLTLSHKALNNLAKCQSKTGFLNILASHRIALHCRPSVLYSSPSLSLGIWQPSKPSSSPVSSQKEIYPIRMPPATPLGLRCVSQPLNPQSILLPPSLLRLLIHTRCSFLEA